MPDFMDTTTTEMPNTESTGLSPGAVAGIVVVFIILALVTAGVVAVGVVLVLRSRKASKITVKVNGEDAMAIGKKILL